MPPRCTDFAKNLRSESVRKKIEEPEMTLQDAKNEKEDEYPAFPNLFLHFVEKIPVVRPYLMLPYFFL